MLHLEKICAYMNFTKTLMRYSFQSSWINWLTTGFLLPYLYSTIPKAVTMPITISCQKAILLNPPMTASSFLLTELSVRCSWFKTLMEQGSLHIHFLSLSYKSLFWELKAHWMTQATANGLLLTLVLQELPLASKVDLKRQQGCSWNHFAWRGFTEMTETY